MRLMSEVRPIGFVGEMCTVVDFNDKWLCEGTYRNLRGCMGQLTFSGTFFGSQLEGSWSITGGTGDFEGATGKVLESFNETTLTSTRVITIGKARNFTARPTEVPTIAPTDVPTETPSASPSLSPSVSPLHPRLIIAYHNNPTRASHNN